MTSTRQRRKTVHNNVLKRVQILLDLIILIFYHREDKPGCSFHLIVNVVNFVRL